MRTTPVLTTLCALTAALTLAPAQALAVDDNPGTGECSAVIGSGGVFWDPITNQFCAADSGFGAGNGGNDGSFGIGPGGGIANGDVSGEEIIEIEELLATKVQPTKSPKRLILLPGRGGGGGWGKPDESTDGPGRTAPRGRGAGGGQKPKKPERKNPEALYKECLRLGDVGAVFNPDARYRLLKSKHQTREELLDAWGELKVVTSLDHWDGARMDVLKAHIRSLEFEIDSLTARVHIMWEAASDFEKEGCPDVLKGGE